MQVKQWLGLILFGLAVGPAVHGSVPADLDVVTMRNGDIHNGTAAQDLFTMELPYGAVSVPYGLMAELHLGNGGGPDRLVTRLGDRFSGRLLARQFRRCARGRQRGGEAGLREPGDPRRGLELSGP